MSKESEWSSRNAIFVTTETTELRCFAHHFNILEQEILLVYVILVFKGQNKRWDSTLKVICSHYEVSDSLQGQVHPF